MLRGMNGAVEVAEKVVEKVVKKAGASADGLLAWDELFAPVVERDPRWFFIANA